MDDIVNCKYINPLVLHLRNGVTSCKTSSKITAIFKLYFVYGCRLFSCSYLFLFINYSIVFCGLLFEFTRECQYVNHLPIVMYCLLV